jgi:hypothetical protein
MASEALGKFHCILLRPFQPYCQSPCPANREKSFESAWRCARKLTILPQRLEEVRIVHGNDAAEQV